MPKSKVGRLHEPEVIKLFESITDDEVCLSILREGLGMDFADYTKVKGAGRKNNRSSERNPTEVRKIIKDWLIKEYIEECKQEELDCILPLTLAERWLHAKQMIKYRYIQN